MFSQQQFERYARHFVLPEIGGSGQKRLLDAKVLVIGAGALGSSALMYLASAGVGTLGIADFDCVSLSNLSRQIIHRTDFVGKCKTKSAEYTLKSINPDVHIILHPEKIMPDNVIETIRSYDFIIDGTDRFGSKFLINDACVLERKPYSHAGAVRFAGQTMTYVPNRGPCLRCILSQVPSGEDAMTCAEAGVFGPVPGILGSIQALEAMKFILDTGELLTGRVLYFDGKKMEFRTLHAKASSKCILCGDHPSLRNLSDRRDDYCEYQACEL